jgi:hypothetical protein
MGVLQQRGLAPRHPQVARLDGYDIDIRERATLIRHATARVYGEVTELTHEELSTLYEDPSVRDDRPEAVVVTLADARQVPAWCGTLPQMTDTHRIRDMRSDSWRWQRRSRFLGTISIDSRDWRKRSRCREADRFQRPACSRLSPGLTSGVDGHGQTEQEADV